MLFSNKGGRTESLDAHMEFDDVYPVGETSVTAQGTHTYHGNDSATYPGESTEYFHEPTSARNKIKCNKRFITLDYV